MKQESNGPDWKRQEAEIQEWFGLNKTVGSGNKWHDISDGTHKGHPSTLVFPLMVDCKSTRAKSYSLNRNFIKDWIKKAGLLGKTFLMPIRFEEDGQKDFDLMVIDMNTFRDMYRVYMQYRTHLEKNGSK